MRSRSALWWSCAAVLLAAIASVVLMLLSTPLPLAPVRDTVVEWLLGWSNPMAFWLPFVLGVLGLSRFEGRLRTSNPQSPRVTGALVVGLSALILVWAWVDFRAGGSGDLISALGLSFWVLGWTAGALLSEPVDNFFFSRYQASKLKARD